MTTPDVAELSSADLTWAGLQLGCCCRTRAALPVTRAVACEVPLIIFTPPGTSLVML